MHPLDDPFVGGEIRHVSEIIKNYFDSEHRKDDELLKYIPEKKNRTIYKRLGYLIEVLSINSIKTLVPDILF